MTKNEGFFGTTQSTYNMHETERSGKIKKTYVSSRRRIFGDILANQLALRAWNLAAKLSSDPIITMLHYDLFALRDVLLYNMVVSLAC